MNIGLIAHDAKKTLLQNLCIAYRSVLAKHTLYATGTSGRLVEEATGLNVRKYLAGHVGGVQQMGSQIEQNDLDLVIFPAGVRNSRNSMSRMSIGLSVSATYTAFRLPPILQRQNADQIIRQRRNGLA